MNMNILKAEEYKPSLFHRKEEGFLASTVVLCLFPVPTFIEH